MNNKFYITAFLLAGIVFMSACQTGKFNTKTVDVNGMIYDFTNRPVAYCLITMNEHFTNNLFIGDTDINGRFTLSKIPFGTYTISGYKSGYEMYQETVTIMDRGQIIYIRIPSQNQLLNLVDEALTAMNFEAAEEYIQRAYQIDKNNIEMLFYYATIKFRQNDYEEAIRYLTTAKELGSRDVYIDRFLSILMELRGPQNEEIYEENY